MHNISQFLGMTLRVIQWTTGNIGRRSLHAIIARPDLELVGVYAHGADKVGGTPPSSPGCRADRRLATNDIDALLALGADACCYNPLWPSIDELVTLLENGVNVCTSAAWITGGKQSPEDRDRIRKACEQGVDDLRQRRPPGHDQPGRHGAQRLVRAGRRDPDHRVGGLLDVRVRREPRPRWVSRHPGHPGLAESVRRESEVFAESAAMMADALGVTLDRMTFDVEFTAATGDSDLGFMRIPAGTIGGVMGYHRGWVGDRNVVSVGFNWTMGDHVTPRSRCSTDTSSRSSACPTCAPSSTACRRRTGARASWTSA